MSSPVRTKFLVLALLATTGLATLPRATSAAPKAAPKLSEETLVPTELFLPEEGKRFGYPDGFDVTYTRTEQGHTWKLVEQSLAMATPSPTPAVAADPAAPPTPTPSPTPDAGPALGPTAEEPDFMANVGFVRPTFVTIAFMESAAAANARVDAFFTAKSDEPARPANLAVMQLERDPKQPGVVVYGREFNLGPKSGGIRRGFSLLMAKGATFVQIDTFWGLKDGAYEAELETLEKRARDMAGWLTKKL